VGRAEPRRRSAGERGERPPPGARRRFAHPSEAELAALLDFYGVRYEYEPVEFVLDWDEDGRPLLAFRPDFWLPEHGVFVELTTARQELVTSKHRKLRLLRQRYPEVEVRLLHRRDYVGLREKYGWAGGSRLAG
jgi:hypoxanthine phosphoribosyltransferase